MNCSARLPERVRAVDPARVVPLLQPFAVGAAVVIGCGVLASVGGTSILRSADAISAGSSPASRDRRDSTVRVTPPAYTKRKPEILDDPVQVSVIAGSRHSSRRRRNRCAGVGCHRIRRLSSFVPGEDRRGSSSVIVVPDAPPLLRVVTPGKDTALAEPKGSVAITLESRDDLGSASLAAAFHEGVGRRREPVVHRRRNAAASRSPQRPAVAWRRRSWRSSRLSLADGDIVVYRAIARDTNPARHARAVRAVPDRDRQERRRSPTPASRCRRRKRSTRSASRW